MTMEELLASQTKKLTTLYRGQEVEGEIVALNDKEIILDLDAKSEGVIPVRGIPAEKLSSLKIGDKFKAFVYIQENENGQVVLSYEKQTPIHLEGVKAHLRGGKSRGGRFIDWSKFTAAQKQKAKLQGKVMEINKGGLIVSVNDRSAPGGEVRGFLPNSQVGFELMSKSGEGPLRQSDSEASMENLIGQDLTITVIEVDANNNKLIFSQRGQVSQEAINKLKEFKKDQKVTGKIVAILPFGLVVDVSGAEGLVFISDVSWEKVDDLSKMFNAGEEIEVMVLGADEELGRLNLSIKQLIEDPFTKLAQNFPADEVVSGEVTGVSESGVNVTLDGVEGSALSAVEGYLPVSKMSPDTKYEAGKSMSFLVDSVDPARRRINLAPFVTSTAGLIYK